MGNTSTNTNFAKENYKIPVSLCMYVLRNKMIAPFRLYLLLKTRGSGKLIINQNIIRSLTETLECNERTVKENLRKLYKLNWCGYNPISKRTFVRGFDNLNIGVDIKTNYASWFDFNDLKTLKEFCFASFIADIIKRKRIAEIDRAGKKGAPFKSISNFFYPISNLYIAKALKISISTAYQYKKAAQLAGYIEVKKNVEEIQNLSIDEAIKLRECTPDLCRNVVIYNKRPHFIYSDLVRSNSQTFKRGRKTKHIRKGI